MAKTTCKGLAQRILDAFDEQMLEESDQLATLGFAIDLFAKAKKIPKDEMTLYLGSLYDLLNDKD